jgi:hypothetical protein
VFRALEDPATTLILVRLIEEAAAPLAEVENLAGQFAQDSTGFSTVTSAPWRRMWCHFSLRSEEFLRHFHRRSNIEATMWMIKSKFGGGVRSRLPTAQANEVLAKVLCHNLTCIIHAVADFGIDVDLGLGRPITPIPPTPAPVQP